MKAPCKDCPDRHELCHAHCAKYLEYRAWRDKKNEEKLATSQLNWASDTQRQASRCKLNRYKRDH